MKKNMGKSDRILRILVGVVILSLGIYNQHWWGVFGFIFLLTGAMSWCPLYVLFKISTKKQSTI